MNIPYTVEARPDTGLHNCKLGIWLLSWASGCFWRRK